MGKIIYTAEARVTGGRMSGRGRTSDGALEVDIAPPGSEGGGTNPEQLFAVGYAACFESALSVVARRKKVELGTVETDARVSLRTTEDRAFELVVELDITLPGVEDADEAKALVDAAHAVCPYSRATRGNIEVTLTANGQTVDVTEREARFATQG